MKKIKQTVETNFIGIEIKDAVIMAPLMDELKSSLVYNHAFTINGIETTKELASKMFDTLAELGFVCSDGSNEIGEIEE